MKVTLMKSWALLLTALSAPGVEAVVVDGAKDQTPYMKAFPLFRSANMASPDKLSTGIGFHSFRIPALVTTATGRMLAFTEGRRFNSEDYGDINLVYKRTKDTTSGGTETSDWEGLQEVVGTGPGTWGNPTPVVDGSTIYLFLSWNGGQYSQKGDQPLPDGTKTKKVDTTWEGRRHLYLTQSTDDGKTWSTPVDMTKQLTPDGYAWDAVGPGHGIKLTSGELVVPANLRNIIGRGSAGKRTWTYQSVPGSGAEGTIAQTFNGQLYRNDRAGTDDNYRKVARGTLSSFGSFALDKGLPDPSCEASTLLYNTDSPARLLFLNSANADQRTHMRVRITYDADAAKFDYGRELSDSPVSGAGKEGGYSCMAKTPDKRIGALVETDWGDSTNHRAIVWRKFNLGWILNGPNN